MTKLIKNFENFTKVQSFGNGFTQWKKDLSGLGLGVSEYLTCVDDTRCTRQLVRSAFEAMEDDIEYGVCFTRDDAIHYGYKY